MALSSAPDTLIAFLDSYIDLGFAIIPIWGVTPEGHCRCPKGPGCEKSRGKHPNPRLAPNGVKNASRDKALVRQWARQCPDGNWAARTGEPLVGGGFAIVVDVDPRNGGDVSLAEIQGHRGQLPETWTQETGGGGEHYVLRCKEAPASRAPAPGIELLGVGKYFMLDPSKHESGGQYAWALGKAPWDVEIADAPAWVVESASTAGRPVRVGEGTARDTVLGEAFALSNMLGVALEDGSIAVKCPWADEHSDARGRGEDSSTVILPPAGGSHFGGFKCMHSHCATRTWMDVRNALPVSAVAEANRRFPMRPVAVVEQEVKDATAPERVKDPMQACKEKLSYKSTKGGGYKLVNDIVNAITILSYDPRWQGVLRFDEFSQVLRFTKEPPWHPDDAPKEPSEVWTDEDVTRLDAWFRRYWALEMKAESIGKAAYVVGRRDQFNPLRDWLDGLVWDGTKRLDTWLHQYLGAEDIAYTRFVGSKWMISAVARVYKPGCKADHLMVLEGPQGKGKSTALRILAGGDAYFSDTPIDIGSKDSFVALRGKFIIELAELASLSKADSDRIKAFFSSPSDSYRPPYGRELVTIPRSCVFAGTVNPNVYLRDETGNRRYWGVACGVIDNDSLSIDRDQLWAEAVARYKAGERWWPVLSERPMLEEQQANREESDLWEEPVAAWLETQAAKKILERRGYLTVTEILENALKLDIGRCGRTEFTRIGIVMTRGLNYRRARAGRERSPVYKPPL